MTEVEIDIRAIIYDTLKTVKRGAAIVDVTNSIYESLFEGENLAKVKQRLEEI